MKSLDKKLLILTLIILSSLAVVFAAVAFKQFNFTFEVREPIDVMYSSFTFSSAGDCNSLSDFDEFNSSIIDYGLLYPGDYKRICFAFISDAEEDIPLSYSVDEAEWNNYFSSWNIVIPADTSVSNARGYAEFQVKPDAEGVFNGDIQFYRG